MKRVLVIGSGGAGKSTFAKQLASRTGLPLIHLDMLYWHDGWVATGNAEWDELVARLLKQDRWIMDGNYGRTMVTRLAACDTVILLDVPRWRCLWRLFRRRFTSVFARRSDLPPGCPDRLTWEFVVWVWEYPGRRRPEVLRRLEDLKSQKRVVILRDDTSIAKFLTEAA